MGFSVVTLTTFGGGVSSTCGTLNSVIGLRERIWFRNEQTSHYQQIVPADLG